MKQNQNEERERREKGRMEERKEGKSNNKQTSFVGLLNKH